MLKVYKYHETEGNQTNSALQKSQNLGSASAKQLTTQSEINNKDNNAYKSLIEAQRGDPRNINRANNLK